MLKNILIVLSLMSTVACVDPYEPTWLNAAVDMRAELNAYAERCAVPASNVMDPAALVCDHVDQCAAVPPPESWDIDQCAEDFAALECSEYINIPPSCRNVFPWGAFGER